MLFDEKRQALWRILTGALAGVSAYLLLSWLTQPGSLFGGRMSLDFTFCFNSQVPEALGAALGFLLWGAFGAETALATLPFADGGRTLLLRSLAHFAVMTATMWAWVLLNFPREPLPGLILDFQLPFTLLYVLVWLGRWVGWYAEVAQLREWLGIAPDPSPLKWRESLPQMGFALVLCLVTGLILHALDAIDVPLLSGVLHPYLLAPVGSLVCGLSMGKRQGFCPLYPLACGGLMVMTTLLIGHGGAWVNGAVTLTAALLGNLGGLLRQKRIQRKERV